MNVCCVFESPMPYSKWSRELRKKWVLKFQRREREKREKSFWGLPNTESQKYLTSFTAEK